MILRFVEPAFSFGASMTTRQDVHHDAAPIGLELLHAMAQQSRFIAEKHSLPLPEKVSMRPIFFVAPHPRR